MLRLTDCNLLVLVTQKPSSPSMALLHDLQSRGCTISELSRLANDAKLGIIRDILYEHCTSMFVEMHIISR